MHPTLTTIFKETILIKKLSIVVSNGHVRILSFLPNERIFVRFFVFGKNRFLLGLRKNFNLGVDVSFVDPFAKSEENLSPDEVLVSKEDLKKLKYQNFATGSGHILIPFIIGIGAGWGTDTRILLQTFW